MEQDDLQFDDPGLKGAIQRAWGSDRAPQSLRGRISYLVATAGSVDDAPAEARSVSTIDRWRSRAYGLAAAAIVIIGIGLLVSFYLGTFDPFTPRYAGAG